MKKSIKKHTLSTLLWRGWGRIITICFLLFGAMATYAQTDNGTAEYDKGKEAARVQNYTETMNWYRKAADKGNPEAMYALGQIYNDKNFMEDGFVVAYFWLNQGLRLYHENSITLLHEIYTQHKAVISLTFGSNINDMGYMAEVIGHEYRNETDEDIALRWFKRSADYGRTHLVQSQKGKKRFTAR